MTNTTFTSPKIKQTQRDPFIQFARGFSILTIVLFHYFRLAPLPFFLAKAVQLGGTGVHVFLFLSGYGLSLSHYKTWGDFFKRRFGKVLIPYYIGIIIIFCLNLLLHIYPDGVKELLSHLFLYKMFIEPYTRSFGGHFWFISTIIQFYLLFPLLVKAVNVLGTQRAFIISVAISFSYAILITFLGKGHMRVWNSFFLQYLWEFVLGMVVARNHLLPKLQQQSWYVHAFVAIIGIGMTALLALRGGQIGQLFNDYFAFAGYVCTCVIIYRISHVFNPLNRFVYWIESFSYSLYIMHMVPISIYLKYFTKQDLTTVTIILIFITALLFSQLFDRIVQYVTASKPVKSLLTT